MGNTILNGAANDAANMGNNYGFNFNLVVEQPVLPYDNEGACAELNKDMERNDNLSIKFNRDADGYTCVWVESRNVAPYKVRLNPEIFSWLMQYLETGKAVCKYNPEPMEPIDADDETYKVDMLKLFVCKHRLYGMSNHGNERVLVHTADCGLVCNLFKAFTFHLCHFRFIRSWIVAQKPYYHGRQQNHCANLLYVLRAFLPHVTQCGTQRGPTVGWQLHYKWCFIFAKCETTQ